MPVISRRRRRTRWHHSSSAQFAGLLAAACLSSAAGAAGVAPGGPDTVATDTPEVVVSAEQPGPGLWKVSKGDHVLWVLGTVSALPKHMKWKTQEVEKALASSQAILSPPGATPDANIGFFSAVMLLPALLGIAKLPDGATLDQVLPPPLYSRWTVQRQRYLGDSRSLERLRPFIAAYKLTEKAYERVGLTDDSEVTSTVRKLAKRYRLKRIDAEYHFFVRDPRGVIKTFKKSSMDESACFSYELDELERSLAQATFLARAWATGDVAALKSSLSDSEDPCIVMFSGSSLVKDLGVQDIDAKVNLTWIEAAEKALSDYQQSFALLQMSDVLLPSGVLPMLRAKGYSVLEPGAR